MDGDKVIESLMEKIVDQAEACDLKRRKTIKSNRLYYNGYYRALQDVVEELEVLTETTNED